MCRSDCNISGATKRRRARTSPDRRPAGRDQSRCAARRSPRGCGPGPPRLVPARTTLRNRAVGQAQRLSPVATRKRKLGPRLGEAKLPEPALCARRGLNRFATSLRHRILEGGLLSEPELDEAIAEYKRVAAVPDTFGLSFMVTQVWGRKPSRADRWKRCYRRLQDSRHPPGHRATRQLLERRRDRCPCR
jgi:hypothetical protein